MQTKKYLGVALAALTTFSVVTSCKDYKDDINTVQHQVDDTKSQLSSAQDAINKLTTQASALEAALTATKASVEASQKSATDAMSKAKEAYEKGNTATAAAEMAKAVADEAKAAVGTAKSEAIADAQEKIEALRKEIADNKLNKEEFTTKMVELDGVIGGLQEGLNKLTGSVQKNTSEIESIYQILGTKKALETDMKVQLEALNMFKANTAEKMTALETQLSEHVTATNDSVSSHLGKIRKLGEKISENVKNIEAAVKKLEAVETEVAAIQADIKKLDVKLDAKVDSLGNVIEGKDAETNAKIDKQVELLNTSISDLQNDLATKAEELKKGIDAAQGDITAINNKIMTEISPDLAALHTIVTSRLTSIQLTPDYFVHGGIPAVSFNSLGYKPLSEENEAELPAGKSKWTKVVAMDAVASYHFSPISFKLANADYRLIDKEAVMLRAATLNASEAVTIVNQALNPAKGSVDFTLRLTQNLSKFVSDPDSEKVSLFALQAMQKDQAIDKDETDATVTSPYYAIWLKDLDARIGDKATLKAKKSVTLFPQTFSEAKSMEPVYKMPYNKAFDLLEKITTVDPEKIEPLRLNDYRLHYRFAVASSEYEVTSGSTTTNQQTYFECLDADKGLYKGNQFNSENIGRTPIFKIELLDEQGEIVRRAFVKVAVVAEKADDLSISASSIYNHVYKCSADKFDMTFTVQDMREKVLRILNNKAEGKTGISHEEFWNTYKVSETKVELKTSTGAYTTDGSLALPKVVDGVTSEGRATKEIKWSGDFARLKNIGNGKTFRATVQLKNKLESSGYPNVITFTFDMTVKLPTVLDTDNALNEVLWLKDSKDQPMYYGLNVARPDSKTSPADDCQYRTDLDNAYDAAYKYTLSEPGACVTPNNYVVTSINVPGLTKAEKKDAIKGIAIDIDHVISLDKNNTALKKAINTGDLVISLSRSVTLQSGDELVIETLPVKVVRPISFTSASSLSVRDAVTGGDIVSFDYGSLLVDWRGSAVIAPSHSTVMEGAWVKVQNLDTQVWQAPHSILKTPASIDFETGTMTLPVGQIVYMGSGEYNAIYKVLVGRPIGFGNYGFYKEVMVKLSEISGMTDASTRMVSLTKAEASLSTSEVHNKLYKKALDIALFENLDATIQDAILQRAEDIANQGLVFKNHKALGTETLSVEVTNESTSSTTTTVPTDIVYITKVNYTPAVYEYIEGQWVTKKHVYSKQPSVEGTTNKEKSPEGDWYWLMEEVTTAVPGQYWDFYGKFGQITVDVDNIKTNLSTGKLPAQSSVQYNAATRELKYENIGSPITHEFTMYVPISVSYGWGTLHSELQVLVKPVK